jgi:hypothetical protein
VFALLVSGARWVSAQSSPEDVVRAFFKAEEEGRWIDAAHMLDLNAFEPIRQNLLRASKFQPQLSRQTPEDLMRWEPDMPRAVAEWQIKKMNESFRDFSYLEHEFARVPSIDSLRALPVDQAAARWLEAKGPKYTTHLANLASTRRPEIDCGEVLDSVQEKTKVEWTSPVAVVLGATAGSDSVRYVVVGRQDWIARPARELSPAPEVGRSPTAVILRNAGGVWKIVPAYDMPYFDGMVGGTVVTSMRCRVKSSPSTAPMKT